MDRYLLCATNRDKEPHDTRAAALREFQQVVATGEWCEVWHQIGPVSGMKIADFPGLN